jgi:hypothetical protein
MSANHAGSHGVFRMALYALWVLAFAVYFYIPKKVPHGFSIAA